MAGVLALGDYIRQTPATGEAWPSLMSLVHQRLPTDPIFNANVVIQNAVVGSGYILLGPDGATVLAGPGTISTDPQTLSSVPAYGNPYIMELRLRKSTAGTRYVPLKQFGPHAVTGISFYVVQQADNVLP